MILSPPMKERPPFESSTRTPVFVTSTISPEMSPTSIVVPRFTNFPIQYMPTILLYEFRLPSPKASPNASANPAMMTFMLLSRMRVLSPNWASANATTKMYTNI